MIKIINCNIFDSGADVVCHQVNCKGVMNNGVAKQVRNRFPNVYEAYKKYCEESENKSGALLGDILDVKVTENGKSYIICNLFGQDNYGSGFCFTDYKALIACLEKVKKAHKNKTIAFPYRMSCSIAGGDWRVVEEIMLDVLDDCDVLICRHKLEG